jgi:DsbC/DsbD-like thiol-disulfide interchange protein
LLRAALLAMLCGAAPAEAAQSAWDEAEASRLRLLLGRTEDGGIAGAIEIELQPLWHTYWRTPGEVGLPPSFDFSGSENVASVAVRFPVPERYDDGETVSLVYRDAALFPFALAAADPARPVVLRLRARFGVCSTICVPTEAEAALSLPPEAPPDAAVEARLRVAAARLPRPADPGRFDVERLTVNGDDLFIDVLAPPSSHQDLFAEPPEGWFVGQPEPLLRDGRRTRYRMSLKGRPGDAEPGGQRFGFLAVAGGEAIEEVLTLP